MVLEAYREKEAEDRWNSYAPCSVICAEVKALDSGDGYAADMCRVSLVTGMSVTVRARLSVECPRDVAPAPALS